MGKSMARIENGVVTNIEWVGDHTVESTDLKNIYKLRVRIGDTYSNGNFYRDGNRILSNREKTRKTVVDYDAALTEIESTIPSTFGLTESTPTTLEDRKQAILSYLGAVMEYVNKDGDI